MRQDEMLLRNAVQALQADEPGAEQMTASARRVADKLGIDTLNESTVVAITSCDDVQHLFGSHRAGTLSHARSMLIEAHIRDCSACRRRFRGGSSAAVLDWSAPKVRRGIAWHPRTFGWALASAFALLVTFFFVYKAYWQVPPGVRAEVQSIDGTAYRISDKGDHQLLPGEMLGEGETMRTSGGGHAVLRLTDGSTVEVNERSVVAVGARGRNMTIALENGAVIVQAAKRTLGHLYVKTPDCRVAVTGTVFSVNSGLKGSRVAVLEGSVHVLHAGTDALTTAGNQFTTNDNLSPEPVPEQIAWSHDRDKYLVLLAQFAALQKQIEQIPFPQPRYTSDLLARGGPRSSSIKPSEAGKATMGRPPAAASSSALGKPSCREESTNADAPGKYAAGERTRPVKRTAASKARSRHSAFRDASSGPAPAIVRSASGSCSRTMTSARSSRSKPFSRASLPTARRCGPGPDQSEGLSRIASRIPFTSRGFGSTARRFSSMESSKARSRAIDGVWQITQSA